MHTNCVIVDGHHVFVSSANLTEAVQDRNIEVGLLVQSRRLARQLTDHFDTPLFCRP
jgi:phosphatidylserine/phosphatidylglycerophosphate/cardiolipin synthase-like enzyme